MPSSAPHAPLRRTAGMPAAVSSAPPRSVLVALWMNGVFGNELYEGIHTWLAEHQADWRIRFVNSPDSYEAAVLWMRRQRILDGVVTHFADHPVTDAVRRDGFPLVCVGPYPPPARHGKEAPRHGRRVSYVGIDLPSVARAVAEHFVGRAGFRSFGYVEHFAGELWSRLRGDAWEAELGRRGLALRRFHHGRRTAGPDFAGLSAWLRGLERPAAVLCANDDMAVDAIRLCELAGLSVPRDIAILGMDDNPLHCQNARPNLSSVHFDARRAGFLAAEALSSMMDDGAPAPSDATLRYGVARISQRASTGAVSTAGALVQKALDFIDANACRGASTADVVRHLGVSRSLATMRFRELRGSSILEAIEARRLAEAKRLLSGSDQYLDAIARDCGYASAGALSRSFRAATGLPPGAWRAAQR